MKPATLLFGSLVATSGVLAIDTPKSHAIDTSGLRPEWIHCMENTNEVPLWFGSFDFETASLDEFCNMDWYNWYMKSWWKRGVFRCVCREYTYSTEDNADMMKNWKEWMDQTCGGHHIGRFSERYHAC